MRQARKVQIKIVKVKSLTHPTSCWKYHTSLSPERFSLATTPTHSQPLFYEED